MERPLVLVLNCGSSSIKFGIIEPAGGERVFFGLVQCIGSATASIQYEQEGQVITRELPNVTYQAALHYIVALLKSIPQIFVKIAAIGHRVVHGAEQFTESVLITPKVITAIRASIFLAPLHNPANIMGIEEALQAFPQLPQVAVFDTAFHQTMPAYAYIYPVPYQFYHKNHIRRYGFHGTSHRFVARQAATLLGRKLEESKFITAHLGNGCSATAISQGKSVDTSMGLTPLEGLMMGTRCGDVDPSLHGYLADNLGYNINQINEILNRESGLLGVSGCASDMREIEQEMAQGNERARLAFEIFCFRLAKYIAALTISLGGFDALIFTGGVGENSILVRARSLAWLQIFKFALDENRNATHGRDSKGIITRTTSPIAMVVPTNEEWMIAQDTARLAQVN